MTAYSFVHLVPKPTLPPPHFACMPVQTGATWSLSNAVNASHIAHPVKNSAFHGGRGPC